MYDTASTIDRIAVASGPPKTISTPDWPSGSTPRPIEKSDQPSLSMSPRATTPGTGLAILTVRVTSACFAASMAIVSPTPPGQVASLSGLALPGFTNRSS